MTDQGKNPDIRVNLPTGEFPPAALSNHFFTAWLGNQVEILFAFVDLTRLINVRDSAKAAGKPAIDFEAEVVSRIVMSGDALPYLIAQLQDIATRAPFQIAAAPVPPTQGS